MAELFAVVVVSTTVVVVINSVVVVISVAVASVVVESVAGTDVVVPSELFTVLLAGVIVMLFGTSRHKVVVSFVTSETIGMTLLPWVETVTLYPIHIVIEAECSVTLVVLVWAVTLIAAQFSAVQETTVTFIRS